MPYYGLFWTRSPYLDLQWRPRNTGTILELLLTSIVRHKNKNRWVGDSLRRSCSLFCVVIFHESIGLVKYPYTKQFTWSPQGIPPSPVLVIMYFISILASYPSIVFQTFLGLEVNIPTFFQNSCCVTLKYTLIKYLDKFCIFLVHKARILCDTVDKFLFLLTFQL